jgi:restriction endonuclease S subunit
MYRNLLIALSVKTLITNISQDKIKDLKIPLPPLPKQKEIAEKVEKMRAEIQEIKNTADETLEQAKNKIGEMLKV